MLGVTPRAGRRGSRTGTARRCRRRRGRLRPRGREGFGRRSLFGHSHVVAAVGVDLVRAEAMPLFMAREALAPYFSLLTGILSEDEMVTFVAPVLPEPPEFEAALEQARVLATNSEPDRAWRW